MFNFFKGIYQDIASFEVSDLTYLLTALFLISSGFGEGGGDSFGLVITGLSLFMVLSRRLRRCWQVWILIFSVFAYVTIDRYYYIDNHKYLIALWMLACGICALQPEPEKGLRSIARQFVGIVLVVSVVQKVIHGEYLDGAFFYYTFLEDGRFSFICHLLTGISQDQLSIIQSASGAVSDFPSGVAISYPDYSGLQSFSVFFSYLILIVETIVGVLFLWPERQGKRWIGTCRDLSLLIFLSTTYVIAPVGRFALILAILGCAQSTSNRVKVSYVTAFILLHFVSFIPDLNDWLVNFYFS